MSATVGASAASRRRSSICASPARTLAICRDASARACLSGSSPTRASVTRRCFPASWKSRTYDFVPPGAILTPKLLKAASHRIQVAALGAASLIRRSVSDILASACPVVSRKDSIQPPYPVCHRNLGG